jgi:hypothetical protein
VITLAELQEADLAYKSTRAQLSEMGAILENIRSGDNNWNTEYEFKYWQVETSPDHYEYYDSVFFEPNTPLMKLYYYHLRWESECEVRFPLSYLGNENYADLERMAIKWREEKEAELKARAIENRARYAEQKIIDDARLRREQYETLKAEFGDS